MPGFSQGGPNQPIGLTTLQRVVTALGFMPSRVVGGTSSSGAVVVSGGNSGYQIDLSPSALAELASGKGWGFFAGGLMQSGELLGTVTWGNPRSFSGTPMDVAEALWGASLDSSITLWAYPGGSRTQVGSITFNRSPIGTIEWDSPVSLPPGSALEVQAPIPADPTLASVRVMSYASE